MKEFPSDIAHWHEGALHTALKNTLGSVFLGLSTYGAGRDISLWFADGAAEGDFDIANTILSAHDPVHLSVDKVVLQANGIDAATVTVSAPKPGAAAIVLSVSANGGAPIDWPIPLNKGVGSDVLTSLDPCVITISLKNPANRSSDILTVRAI